MARANILEKWQRAKEVQLGTVLDLGLSDATVYRLGRLVITSVRLHDVGLVGSKEPASAVSEPPSDTEVSSLALELASMGLPTSFGKKCAVDHGQNRRKGKRVASKSTRLAHKELQSHAAKGSASGAADSSYGDAMGVKDAMDTPWLQGFDERWGCHYYYNMLTQESVWEAPAEGYVPWEDQAQDTSGEVAAGTGNVAGVAGDDGDGKGRAADAAAAATVAEAAAVLQDLEEVDAGPPGAPAVAAVAPDRRVEVLGSSATAAAGPDPVVRTVPAAAATAAAAAAAASPAQTSVASCVPAPSGALRQPPRMLTEEDLLRAMGLWEDPSPGLGTGSQAQRQQQPAVVPPIAAADPAVRADHLPPESSSGTGRQDSGHTVLKDLLLRPPVGQLQQQWNRAMPSNALLEEQLLARLEAAAAGIGAMPPPPPPPLPPPASPPPPFVEALAAQAPQQAAQVPSQPVAATPAAAPAGAPRPPQQLAQAPPARMLTEEDVMRSMGLLPALGPPPPQAEQPPLRGSPPAPGPPEAAPQAAAGVPAPPRAPAPPPGFGVSQPGIPGPGGSDQAGRLQQYLATPSFVGAHQGTVQGPGHPGNTSQGCPGQPPPQQQQLPNSPAPSPVGHYHPHHRHPHRQHHSHTGSPGSDIHQHQHPQGPLPGALPWLPRPAPPPGFYPQLEPHPHPPGPGASSPRPPDPQHPQLHLYPHRHPEKQVPSGGSGFPAGHTAGRDPAAPPRAPPGFAPPHLQPPPMDVWPPGAPILPSPLPPAPTGSPDSFPPHYPPHGPPMPLPPLPPPGFGHGHGPMPYGMPPYLCGDHFYPPYGPSPHHGLPPYGPAMLAGCPPPSLPPFPPGGFLPPPPGPDPTPHGPLGAISPHLHPQLPHHPPHPHHPPNGHPGHLPGHPHPHAHPLGPPHPSHQHPIHGFPAGAAGHEPRGPRLVLSPPPTPAGAARLGPSSEDVVLVSVPVPGPAADGLGRRGVTWTLEELERQLEIMAISAATDDDGHTAAAAAAATAVVAVGGIQAAASASDVAAVVGKGLDPDHQHQPKMRGQSQGRSAGPQQQRQQHKQHQGAQGAGGRQQQQQRAGGSAGRRSGGGRAGGSGAVSANGDGGDDDAAFYDSFVGSAGSGRGSGAGEHAGSRPGSVPKPPVGTDDGTRRVTLDPATAAYVRTLLPRSAAKYWMQRYSLFSRFDSSVQLDTEGWWSVTPEVLAAHQAARCKELCASGLVAMDACCGCGGNVIQMAGAFPLVIGVEISERRVEMARHNASVYGVSHKCQFLCADFFHVAPDLKVDVLFMSPPWGGPKYHHVNTFDVFYPLVGFNKSLLRLLDVTLDCVRGQDGVVAAFLPRNTDLAQLAAVVPEHAVWEVERAYVNNKLKGITVYSHAGHHPGEANVRLEAEAEFGQGHGQGKQEV